jgi:hypothetical protein
MDSVYVMNQLDIVRENDDVTVSLLFQFFAPVLDS